MEGFEVVLELQPHRAGCRFVQRSFNSNRDTTDAFQLQVTMQTLMNLCNCINAAAHARTRHVPWRDSRLTRVLSDVFDGQHVIFLLAHTRYNAGESWRIFVSLR